MLTVESTSDASNTTTSSLSLFVETPDVSSNPDDLNGLRFTEGASEETSLQSFWQRWQAEIKVFASTFLTIFLAELGDKTQLTTLLMSAESQSPWTVFAGAGAALILTSLLGVLVGSWLAKRVSAKTLEKAAAVMLLVIAALLIWDVITS
ncbi:MAG: TMEM165/GDT1 family protein [Oscillatoriophycideae cyanobacterium NC_groundwater_1537_Pr4_S-0.65um_50_18]|nr:TMEM165/GDT1 family protein [Oscillatoriophycideae cyanobacterium NC_groundwater_1537_Pr4_S-0.65um_50_18]